MNAKAMSDAGFERTLRHALHTELAMRLRHTLLHGLKGPVQTILSALHLLQKKAAAGELQELDKYAGWIKNAAHELVERAQTIVPPKPLAQGEQARADLHALSEDVLHLLRDEAAVKGVELDIVAPAANSVARAPAADIRLALQAILFGVIDALPAGGRARITSGQTDGGSGRIEWTMEADAGHNPPPEAFEPRYDVAAPGSGIAWHVARSTVEECGGRLLVENLGEGWCIKVSLPGV